MTDLSPVIVGGDEGESVFLVGDTYTTLLTGAQTGGAFTLLEAVVMPDAGPPPHRHHHEEETFVLLEGSMTFTVDGVDHLATPGSVILVQRNVVHSYRTAGDNPARMLFLYSPPGMEGMFPELGRPGVRARGAAAPGPGRPRRHGGGVGRVPLLLRGPGVSAADPRADWPSRTLRGGCEGYNSRASPGAVPEPYDPGRTCSAW